MNTALAISINIDIWQDEVKLAEIRKIISPSAPLTDVEFDLVVGIGRATQLNPFMRELWVVKYNPKAAAQIFIGRDGYRKGAQRDKDYEYHQVNAVYSKDDFKIMDDKIHHSYGVSDRGALIGAYCKVKRKSSAQYTYVLVSMEEYNAKQSLWKDKPETMIKKVAEAQGLRQGFQDILGGTYSDAELPQQPLNIIPQDPIPGATNTEKLKNVLKMREHGPITVEQLEVDEFLNQEDSLRVNHIYDLISAVGLSEERICKALEHYSVNSIEDLSTNQCQDFITNLQKLRDKQHKNED